MLLSPDDSYSKVEYSHVKPIHDRIWTVITELLDALFRDNDTNESEYQSVTSKGK